MLKYLAAIVPGLFLFTTTGAQTDSVVAQRIADQILLKGQCYDDLRVLCKTIGHRLSATPAAAKAVAWAAAALKEAGADRVILQPVWVPRWVRGPESLFVTLPGVGKRKIEMLSLGNAAGTGGKPLTAELLVVPSLEAFSAIPATEVKGKIVFFNYAFRQDFVNTFRAYGDAIKYRGVAPSAVSAKGGIGVIIRSLSTSLDDAPHTGAMRYADTVKKIPAVAIGNTTAQMIFDAAAKGKITATITSSCRFMDSVMSYNVIGELQGSGHPEEFIAVGGHLDSWDIAEGANDDGSGCVQSIEVIRTFKALGIRPKRTVRAVMFMNEENGLRGGRAYADSAISRGEKHILAMESDAGGFTPRGIGTSGFSDAQTARLRSWAPLFRRLNVYDLEGEGDGADISPLERAGTPLCGLMPDPQRYFEIHHSRHDVFENVNHRELKMGAAVMATLVYLVSEHGL